MAACKGLKTMQNRQPSGQRGRGRLHEVVVH